MSNTVASFNPVVETPAAPLPAKGPTSRVLTQPERISQAMDDRRNEENHRPAPKKQAH